MVPWIESAPLPFNGLARITDGALLAATLPLTLIPVVKLCPLQRRPSLKGISHTELKIVPFIIPQRLIGGLRLTLPFTFSTCSA